MQKHGLFKSKKELDKHQGLMAMAKMNRRYTRQDELLMVDCPNCEASRIFPRNTIFQSDQDREFACFTCHKRFTISPLYATIRALERMEADDSGRNDGWARCPRCSILISKGDGCPHMICGYCDHELSFDEAVDSVFKFPFARPSENEIYKWW
jgi:uncharacterized CHY-type Zn-finger protein